MIEKVLVTVMTYPALSDKHFETVCTAGFREDSVAAVTTAVSLIGRSKRCGTRAFA